MYNNFKAAPNLGNRGKINENVFFPLRMVTLHVFEILSDFLTPLTVKRNI
jgi:hypothetical protein